MFDIFSSHEPLTPPFHAIPPLLHILMGLSYTPSGGLLGIAHIFLSLSLLLLPPGNTGAGHTSHHSLSPLPALLPSCLLLSLDPSFSCLFFLPAYSSLLSLPLSYHLLPPTSSSVLPSSFVNALIFSTTLFCYLMEHLATYSYQKLMFHN